MKLKKGVNITGIRPELMVGLMVAQAVYQELGVELVITSANDSKHSKTSLHYAGAALDFRTRNMNELAKEKAHKFISLALPDDFDVILEKDHIHMEHQPRRR